MVLSRGYTIVPVRVLGGWRNRVPEMQRLHRLHNPAPPGKAWNEEKWRYLAGAGSGDPTKDLYPLSIVAIWQQQIVGQGHIVLCDSPCQQWKNVGPWLAGICVLEDHRKKGVGDAIVNKLVEQARQHIQPQPKELWLWTENGGPFAPWTCMWYQRLGWREEDSYLQTHVPSGTDYSVVVMRHQLAA